MTIQKCLKITLHWFLLTALTGLMLRFFFVTPVSFLNFKYLLHSHSHIAILGWLFLAAYLFIVKSYISNDGQKKFLKLFMWFQIAVAGMFITFLIQGYGAFSIFFSTVHIILSYIFVYMVLREKIDSKKSFSFSFIKMSFLFLIISTIAPWFLSYLAANNLIATDLYFNTIYFYLHFQYNGWLSFAAFGLFFKYLEKNNIAFNISNAKKFRNLMFIACFPAYFLSILWIKPHFIFYVTGFIAGILQVIALIFFMKNIPEIKFPFKKLTGDLNSTIVFISLASFIIKIIMQLFSAIPFFADIAFQYRNLVIGYLHLTLIGFLSLFFLFLLNVNGVIDTGLKKVRNGYFVFITGFILSEVLIFIQPLFAFAKVRIPQYDLILFTISILILAGILMIALNPKMKE